MSVMAESRKRHPKPYKAEVTREAEGRSGTLGELTNANQD